MADAAPVDNSNQPTAAAMPPQFQQIFNSLPLPPNVIPFQAARDKVMQKQEALPVPKAPTLQPIPQNVPQAQVTPIFQAMTPEMMLFAALGGALTKNAIASTAN